MTIKKTAVCIILVLVSFAIFVAADSDKAVKPRKELVKIGIFDSRAVAMAYANSSWFSNEEMRGKMAEMEKAKAAGDKEKMQALDQWGNRQQEKLHRQGFGAASVSEYLKLVEKEIPAAAKQAGVDVIVSKWDITYQDEGIEFVDVTVAIVKLFQPPEKVFKWIEDLKKVKPLSEKELENFKD
jgi:hypothetical protein